MGFLVFVLMVATLGASTLTVSESGTFDSNVAMSSFTSPDATWSYSFDVDSNPSVSNVMEGDSFDVAFTDFSYTLNGLPVNIVPDDIRVFSQGESGLLNVCFISSCSDDLNPLDGFEIEGAQIYSGSEASPTILSGSYSPSSLDIFVNSNSFGELTGAGPVNIAVAPTPEPSYVTVLACGGALLLCLFVRNRKRVKVI